MVDASQQLTDQRTQRLFVGAFTSLLAASDQSNAGADDGVGTPTGQYQIYGTYGYGVEGRPVSQGQQSGQVKQRIPMLALVLVAAFALHWAFEK